MRDEELAISDCGLEHTDIEGAPEVEVGQDFRSDYWGRGLATEAATAVRDFAFGELGLPPDETVSAVIVFPVMVGEEERQ